MGGTVVKSVIQLHLVGPAWQDGRTQSHQDLLSLTAIEIWEWLLSRIISCSGIKGNEEADKAAKEATHMARSNVNIPVTDCVTHIKVGIINKWDGYILPNQVNPDILWSSMSMSAALRFGCLSVRKFFWEVQEVYFKLHKGLPPPSHSLTAQLIWREFFYCMSANNPKYDKMKGNPICIDIPWYKMKST
ncbi:cryptochrome-1-like [Macrobrachium rosenbergii]|uniref:cryptochrome-1-like n=1 Tax=Macrobrachium rosenbergii TaxID=79674 RepID=UPI0034D49CF0